MYAVASITRNGKPEVRTLRIAETWKQALDYGVQIAEKLCYPSEYGSDSLGQWRESVRATLESVSEYEGTGSGNTYLIAIVRY